MKARLSWAMAAMLLCTTASAEALQAVNTANGKAVKRISFDREQVTIVYADGTQETNVKKVLIRRGASNSTTSVNALKAAQRQGAGATYDMQGRRITTPWAKGIYVEKTGNGMRKTVKK